MPATIVDQLRPKSRAQVIFTWIALLGLPGSLSSPGATISMALVAIYGTRLAFKHGLDADLTRVFRWMLGCYLLLFVVDMMNGGFLDNLKGTAVNYLPLIALAPYAQAIRSLRIEGRTVERMMQVTVGIATAATIYLLLAGEHRPGGLNLNSVPFSLVVGMWGVILLSLGLWRGRSGLASTFMGLLAVVPVILSESKIALICLLTGYCVVGLLWAVETRRWRVLGAALALLATGVVVLWASGGLWRAEEFLAEVDVYISTGGLRGGSFGQRYQLLVAGWQAFLERPILGFGLDGRMSAVFAHITGYDIGTKSLGHLHNDYMTHIVSYGIFGAVFLLAYFIGLWRLVIRPADAGFEWSGVAVIAMLIIYMAADVAFNMDPISGATTVAFGIMLAWARSARRQPVAAGSPPGAAAGLQKGHALL